MNQSPIPSSFIIDFFKEFYAQVISHKEQALQFVETIENPTEKETPPETVTPPIQDLCRFIQKDLRLLLEEQSLKSAKQVGEFARAHYEEAQYIMVALCDEIFLNLHWVGIKEWEKSILEGQIFHTQVAGEVFFNNLEDFIKANDPIRKDLAVIYLMALSLGFRGKYRGQDDEEKMKWYKNQLYIIIHKKPSDLFHRQRTYLTETCYRYTLSENVSRGLPDIRLWSFAFLGVIGTYLFFTYVLWYKLVREMDEAVGFIIDQAKYLPLS